MLVVSGLGLNFDVGPTPKFDVGDFPDEPMTAADLSTMTQAQTSYAQTLVKSVAGQLEADVDQLKKRVYVIGAIAGVVGATGIALGIFALKKRG